MNPTTLLSGLGAAITADPGLGGANSFGRDATPGTGDLFLSLVSGMLGGAAAGTSPAADGTVVTLPTAGATGTTTGDAAAGGPVPTPGTVLPTEPTDPAAALPLTPTALAQAVPTAGRPSLLADAVDGAPDARDAADRDDPVDEASAPPVAAFALAALAPLAVQALQSAISPRPALAPADPAADAATTGRTTSPSAGVDVAAATATSDGTPAPIPTADPAADPAGGRASDQASGQTGGQPQPQQAGPTTADRSGPVTAPTGLHAAAVHAARPEASDLTVEGASATATPLPAAGAAAPTAPAATTPTGQQAPASRVAEQVFPEVLRIASSGTDTGPRRVTVKLNPEALGEVRVVLTQRRGGLEVSLSAGSDAQRALAEGAPELRRLLEAVGRVDSRIVIRDLPSASSTGSAPTPTPSASPDGTALRTDVSTDLGGNAWSGAGRHDGEPAADREATRYRAPGSTNATDGTPRATSPSRPTTTGTSGRSGLDVTI